MGEVRKEITIVGTRSRVTVRGVVDTGASDLNIPQRIADIVGVSNVGIGPRRMADGRIVQAKTGMVLDVILLGRSTRDVVGSRTLVPVTILGNEVLIGVGVLEWLNMSVDPTSGTLEDRGAVLRARVGRVSPQRNPSTLATFPTDRLVTSGNKKHPKSGDIVSWQRYDINRKVWATKDKATFGSPNYDSFIDKWNSFALRTRERLGASTKNPAKIHVSRTLGEAALWGVGFGAGWMALEAGKNAVMKNPRGKKNPADKLVWHIASADPNSPYAGKVGLWLLTPPERRKRSNNFGYFSTVQAAQTKAKSLSSGSPIPIHMLSRNPAHYCPSCHKPIAGNPEPGDYTCGGCKAPVRVG